MKTWSRLSSLICGRNECRLKRVTGGGPAPPRSSRARRREGEHETNILRVALPKCGNFCEARMYAFHASTVMAFGAQEMSC
jgi:hypothetical protein